MRCGKFIASDDGDGGCGGRASYLPSSGAGRFLLAGLIMLAASVNALCIGVGVLKPAVKSQSGAIIARPQRNRDGTALPGAV